MRADFPGEDGMRDHNGLKRAGCCVAAALTVIAAGMASAQTSPYRRDVTLSIELPDNPTTGARLFVDKGCVRCHALAGDASRVGPDLGRLHFRGTVMDLAGSF